MSVRKLFITSYHSMSINQTVAVCDLKAVYRALIELLASRFLADMFTLGESVSRRSTPATDRGTLEVPMNRLHLTLIFFRARAATTYNNQL